MLEDIDRILGDGKLVGVGFEPAEVHFQIDPESIRLAPFEIAVQDLRLQIAGSMDRNGVLDLSAAISAPRDRMELRDLPDEVLDRLADDQGRVSISFQIRGTRDRPRVIPDLPELTRDELDRLEEHLKSKLKEALDELLRSRDEG